MKEKYIIDEELPAYVTKEHVVGEKDGKKYDFYAYRVHVELGDGVELHFPVDGMNKALIIAGEKFGKIQYTQYE